VVPEVVVAVDRAPAVPEVVAVGQVPVVVVAVAGAAAAEEEAEAATNTLSAVSACIVCISSGIETTCDRSGAAMSETV
jgi:hypothetical protein